MATWVARIITSEFVCEADNFEEAEAKYDAYFDGDEEAGIMEEDVDHIWTVS